MDRSRHCKPLDPHFAYPLPKNFYGSDDFANDELPQHGCIDFGHGGEAQRPRGSPGEDHGAQPVFSTRKAKRKLWKKRSKALKAAYKAQAALGLHSTGGTDDITTEKQQVPPEQEGKKRRDGPTDADEPKFKIAKTSCESTGDHKDSANKAEQPERAAARTVSISGAEGLNNEELPQLKIKFQNKKVQPSDNGAGSHAEEIHEKASKSAAVRESYTSYKKVDPQQRRQSNEHSGTRTGHERNPKKKAKKKNQTYFWNPGMKITAQRVAFVCSVCKFHSFYRKKLAEHLESTFHKEHFKFLLEHLSEPTVNFLQGHFKKRQNNVENFISHLQNHRETLCQLYEDRDLTRDISMENFIRKAEAAHCVACNMYIPMVHQLIQKHLKSPEHNQNCRMMMVESKQMGLSIAQRILSERFMKKKLKLYLKDAMVTNKPEVNQEVPNAVPDMMSQDAFCDQVSKASEAVRNRKDQVEPFCEQVINTEEEPGERKDQQVEPFCEQVINTEEEPGERKDQQVEPFCERVINAEEEPGERKDQQVEPFCERVINAEEEPGEQKDQVVEPFFERVINADEEPGERKDQEVEPFCEQGIEAEETVREPENQEVATSSEGMITATEAVMNRREQQAVPMWEESNPAVVPKRNEDVQEKPERQDLAQLLFSLLDEEEDMEGVELGEEEQEENEYL
ncbi:A-kinase anchor protein 8-like isoform X1 [Silurus meridionalis]|uniref:A-kinase anchor protein 8-like isoform X1 n=1 Tax=Silurus meridionalis TaxID=175797 RepID=UPI001EEC651E|nr:A-kinase anchor protein 8-like isoform X1 [Silurus meridionalis]XP_046693401.1 A-kinase anchor protein 8-like isoform X1 [Silurus meridionalis]